MITSEIGQLNMRFDEQDKKFTKRFDEQDKKFNELLVFLNEQFGRMATKSDLAQLGAELRAEMVTKGEFYTEIRPLQSDIAEIKETVNRLDRRTDEDIRATIKDVDKIKTYLVKRGHQI